MKPETVLNIKPGEKAQKTKELWLKEYGDERYKSASNEVSILSKRIEQAYALLDKERHKKSLFNKITGNTYEKQCEQLDNQEYLLCNEEDASFANTLFSIKEIVQIQLGDVDEVDSEYTSKMEDIPMRKAFLYEIKGDLVEAAKGYEESEIELYQERGKKCRKLAEELGEENYKKGLSLIEADEWDEAYIFINNAVRYEHREAMAQLGLMFVNGKGIIQDQEIGVMWLEEAARFGNEMAANLLKEMQSC